MMSVWCVAVLSISTAAPAVAATDPDTAFFDAVLGRPVGLAATVIGGAMFVVSLPVTATSGSIKSSANSLVGKPARFTFTRPLGDFRYRHDSDYYAGKKNSKPVAAKQNQAITHSGGSL